MCIVPFKTEEEVIRRANSVDYGLAASVWCQDMGTLTRVAQALQVSSRAPLDVYLYLVPRDLVPRDLVPH